MMNSERDVLNYINSSTCFDYELIPDRLRTPRVIERSLQIRLDVLKFIDFTKVTPEVILSGLEPHGITFRTLPDFLKTKALVDAALRKDVNNFKYIPTGEITADQAFYAVGRNFSFIRYVPGELHSQALWLLGANTNVVDLNDVPLIFRSRRLCLNFVSYDFYNLKYVPMHIKDEDFFYDILKPDQGIGDGNRYMNDCLLKYWPENIKTRALCLAAVTFDPREFVWVPKEMHDFELCAPFIEYVNYHPDGPYIEESLPRELITKNLCQAAIKAGRTYLVKDYLNDEQLRVLAVGQDPMNLEFIGHEHQTEFLCRSAYDRNPACGEFIEPNILDQLKKAQMNWKKY